MNWTTTTTNWLNHTPQQQHQPNFSTMWHHNPNPNKKFFKENTTTRPQHYFSSKCNPICVSTTISPQVWSKLWSLLGKTNYNPNHNQNLWKVNTITTIFFPKITTTTTIFWPPQPQPLPQFWESEHHNKNTILGGKLPQIVVYHNWATILSSSLTRTPKITNLGPNSTLRTST